MTDILDQAIAFAVKAHEGAVRKSGGVPYILHPLETAVIVSTLTSEREIMAAAVLHDVLEDTSATEAQIRELFGERITALVVSETEDKRRNRPASETWHMRKEESLAALKRNPDPAAGLIWLSDKLSNMRSFYRDYLRNPDRLWDNFNMKDPCEQCWYYTHARDAVSYLSDTVAWQELDRLIRIVFAEELK